MIRLPGVPAPLVIRSPGATTMPYVKSVIVNGVRLDRPIIMHEQIARGGEIFFEMSQKPQVWASEILAS
jgi:putative alpha-1,2-mannosidase